MNAVVLYRLEVRCEACGKDWHTFVSASIDLDGDEGRRIINEACDAHTLVCPVRCEHQWDGDPHNPRCVNGCGAEWEGP
jgi:hypothetical protein